MSEAYYIFKATFQNELKKKDIQNIKSFFREMGKAHVWWNNNREKAAYKEFWTELSNKFPTVSKYINTQTTYVKPHNHNSLSGLLIWLPPENDLDEYLTIKTHTVKFCGEQSTFLTLDGLATFFKSHFGAVDTRWGSDEYLDMEEILDMEAGNDVVNAILNQKKENLPVFMNVHPLLDAKIAEKLKEL